MKNKRTSDFGSDAKKETLVLREKIWRFEMSASKAKRFFTRHKGRVIAVFVLVLAVIVVRYAFIGFASTADFYPSSCLGDWENVQNALGKPDLPSGAPATAFTPLNSAVFGTSTAQMFCGNFTGDTDINTLTGESFQEADLVLSWSFVFPEDASLAATSTPADASTSASDTISAEGGGSASGTLPVDENSSSAASVATSSPSSTVDTSGSVDSSTASSTLGSASAPTSSQATPADTAPPVASSTDTSPVSWFEKFMGVAYADETSSMATDVNATDSSTALIVASSGGEEDVSSGSQVAPITVNTSMFQNIVLPSSTANAILGIVYSTDGVTWQPIVNIDSSNWQQERYQIPIHSWAELEHLQIAFVGLGASSSPQIFLDAAGVEVSYADAPEGTTAPSPNPSSTGETASSTLDTLNTTPQTSTPPVSPADNLPSPAQALENAFSPQAAQKCSVNPFSASVARGGSAAFLLKLIPPKAASSSAPVSPSSFLYNATLGSLPSGISAYITTSVPGNDTIVTQASAAAVPGSYSVIVVYRERQANGSVLPNYCQFSLVVE